GLLARRDVCECDEDEIPLCLVAGHHPELHVIVQGCAFEGVAGDLALLKDDAFPQVDELFAKWPEGIVAEDLVEAGEKGGLVGRLVKTQSMQVDVDHADFLQAALDKVWMHIGECA